VDEFDWLKEAVDKIEKKVDSIDQRIDKVDVTLVEQAAVLKEHHRRSIANEQNLELLRKEFKPVETHVHTMNTVFKIIGVIASAASLIVGIIRAITALF
jgi:hypothetical protein